MKTILVVDDAPGVRDLVGDYLAEQGFRVVTAGDGREAMFVARHEKPDLILLDIMMPHLSGYDFLREHGRESDTPIILLTAKVEEADRVIGLELGADDYVTKPFSLRELAARIRAVLRRTTAPAPMPAVLRVADVVLDRGTREVRVGDRQVHLTPTEFEILAQLMSQPGRVFTRDGLLETIHGIAFESQERSIDVHVRNIRRKMRRAPGGPQDIETVFGVGYRFRADTQDRSGA